MLVHEAVPTCVVGDPGRFRQVLDCWGFILQFLLLECVKARSAQHSMVIIIILTNFSVPGVLKVRIYTYSGGFFSCPP